MLFISKENRIFGSKPENSVLVIEKGDVRLELGGIPPVEALEGALEFLGIESPLDILEAVLEADSLEGILENLKKVGKEFGVNGVEYVDTPGSIGTVDGGVRIPLLSATSGNLGSLIFKGDPSPEFILKVLAVVDALASISEGYILMRRGREMLESVLDVLAEALEKRVKGGERAKKIREEILKKAGKDLYDDVEILRLSLRVYDVGKIGVRDSILMKLEWEMSPDEFEEYKRHPEYGYEILKSIRELPGEILDAVLYHHERLNGKGYPKGLKGEEIPRIALVVGAMDEFSTRLASQEEVDDVLKRMKEGFPEDILRILGEAIE